MRDKWDRKQSGTTYGIITLQKAVSGCTQTYNPKQHNDYSISIGEGKAVQAVDEEKCVPTPLTIWAMPTGSLIYSAIM